MSNTTGAYALWCFCTGGGNMKKVISVRLASTVIIAISAAALLMHVLILLKVLPYDFVWGGRLTTEADVMRFEIVSIVMQAFFLLIVAAKAGYVFKGKFTRTVNVAIWVLFAMMVLNTFGNLASNSGFETMVMTPVTIVLALLLFRLGIEKHHR